MAIADSTDRLPSGRGPKSWNSSKRLQVLGQDRLVPEEGGHPGRRDPGRGISGDRGGSSASSQPRTVAARPASTYVSQFAWTSSCGLARAAAGE